MRPQLIAQHAAIAPASETGYKPIGGRPDVQHNVTGLARVSTDIQDSQLQRTALGKAGAGGIFEEKPSPAITRRPAFAALGYLRPGDTL